MTHYCSNILCLSKDNIPASIVCYSRDRCTVIGCAPVFSPLGLFLKYNLWEWKKNPNWRRRWRVCCKITQVRLNSHLSLLRHSKLLKKQVDDIVVYEDLTGEVRFSKHLPNPHNLNKWVLWLHEQVDLLLRTWNFEFFCVCSVMWNRIFGGNFIHQYLIGSWKWSVILLVNFISTLLLGYNNRR